MRTGCVHAATVALLGAALILVLAAETTQANVYVSGVKVDASDLSGLCGVLKVSYVLNENADGDGTRPGIQIEVLDDGDPPVAVRTVSIAALPKGPHTWEWDGRKDDGSPAAYATYSIRITAADQGHSTWTVISDAAAPQSFFAGKSVAVNKRPASPYYGMVYVAESNGGSTAYRSTEDGIYALHADGRQAYFSNAVDPAGTMTNWTHDGTSASAPFKLNIGPDDDRVYVTSFYDDLAFDFPPDLANCTQLIDSSNRTDKQFVFSAYGTGKKESGNRRLWLVNSNYNDTSRKGLIRYSLNADDKMGSGKTGTKYVGPAAYPFFPRDIDRDPVAANAPEPTNGDFYMNTYRASPNQAPAIEKFDGNAPGSALPLSQSIWSSSDDYTYPLGIGFGRDEFAQPGWPKNIIAYGQEGTGYVYFFNANTGDYVANLQVEASANIGDVAFDDAGNLYTISSTGSKLLRVWSPPDGPNFKSFTTETFLLDKPATSGPTITVPPADVLLCPGSNAAFDVQASGSGLSYKWRKNGVELTNGLNADGVTVAGADTSSLSLTNIPAAYNGAQISVLVCDDNGVVVSPLATLQIGVRMVQPPAPQTVCQLTDATFTVVAAGKGALTYQWQNDDIGNGVFVNIPGETSADLTVSGVLTAMTNTQYRVIVTDDCGPVASPPAKLTVKGKPVITHVGYGNTQLPYGSNWSMSCYATGTGLLRYQWKKDGQVIPGATSAGYEIIRATCEDSGVYSCTVTDDCGSATRDTTIQGGKARVTVIPGLDVCGDGIDQDCDGIIDNGEPEKTVDKCTDGVDNDCDGLVDCDDPDCLGVGACCNLPWGDAHGPTGIGHGFGDGDIDQDDFAVFQLCISADPLPMPLEPTYCSCFDRTGPEGTPDGHVDLEDFALFAKCGTGPSVSWTPTADCP